MSDSSLAARALSLALATPATVTALPPDPPAAASPSSRAALRKCRAAWQRAFNAYIKDYEDPSSIDEVFAEKEAAKAFSTAMPALVGPEGIRDFIACAAYGILIGAIPADRSGQILYAAQVALAALPRNSNNSG
jgi:hypothetical protein